MGKYDNRYANHNFGDHDLDLDYQGVEKIEMLHCIANELAETNRLKRIELKIMQASLSTSESQEVREVVNRLEDKEFEDKA